MIYFIKELTSFIDENCLLSIHVGSEMKKLPSTHIFPGEDFYNKGKKLRIGEKKKTR
jgi:hypothetical protein